jgi:spermidine/putrescine transport system permease protein
VSTTLVERDATRHAVVPGWYPPPFLRRLATWALNGWAVLGFVFLFAPIVVIIAFSFNRPEGKFNFVWNEFTFENWQHPFAKRELVDSFIVSLQIATIAAIVATIFGALIALALVRYRFHGGAFVNLLLVLPLTAPEIVLGASLLTLFLDPPQPHDSISWAWNDERGFRTIVIAHIMFCISFVALTVKARLRGFDWTLEDAAMDLGATPARTFRKVTFPLIVPGILAAALLSFALSLDDFIITLFVRGDVNTFPLQVYGAARVEVPPQINVLATIVLAASVSLLAAGSAIRAWRER